MPDQAEIHKKSIVEKIGDRQEAVELLKAHFSSHSNQDQAWRDLHKLTQNEESDVRRRAADALGTAFGQVTDKDQAWQDLFRLAQDEDRYMRWRAANALGTAFGQVADKDQAWRDLHKLTQNEESDVRWRAACALRTAVGQVTDKDQAWQDLFRLAQGEDHYVRWSAAYALKIAFGQVTDKDQAWQDLFRLTQGEDSDVRWRAAEVMGTAFGQVTDKDQAWQNLQALTQGEDSDVRWRAAHVLGTVFSRVTDKDQVWQDLLTLTQDENNYVRMYAYHSLGRASVFKATESKDRNTLKNELEAAVAYFERSSRESPFSPARFCHLFYRTYYTITFQEAREDEVQKYLAETKEAVGGSESKDDLFNAIENLARGLQESQRLKGRSFLEVTSELNAYRWYCENAADYMAAAEDKAPGVVKLLRKCNPLIEENIQTTITEIQEKARQICHITRGSGTEFEAPGAEINRAAKALSPENIHRTQRSITRITFQLKKFCRLLPEGNRELVCDVVKEIEQATEFPDKLDKIELAFTYVSSAVGTALQLEDISLDLKKVMTELGVVNNKLDEIRYAIFKQKISSGNAISNLTSIRTELEKLYQFNLQHPESSLKELYSCREEQLEELSRDLDDRFAELKVVLMGKASKDDFKNVLSELEKLKPAETWNSKVWNLADKGATLLTYLSFLHEVIAVLRPG